MPGETPELRNPLNGVAPQSTTGAAAGSVPVPYDTNLLITSQPGIIELALNDISRPLKASEIKQMAAAAETLRAAGLTDSEIVNLTAEVLLSGKALDIAARGVLRGSMANLRKIQELPYALYVFGTVIPDGKDDFAEDEDIAQPEKAHVTKSGHTEFLKISEAVKMASVLHNIYYGGTGHFPEETPWYAPYIRYALKNGIIKSRDFSDVDEYATRAEAAYIFSCCVPKAELPVINYIPDISDVSESLGFGESIYLLFRAGVLTRNDKKGSFYPDSMITRTEAASIIGRIATPDDRKRII
jgi:hypothetical protein